METEKREPTTKEEYFNTLMKLVEDGDVDQVEFLLREKHSLTPGEREAFLWLQEELPKKYGEDRKPMVKLDKTELHVIPIEQEEE